MQPIYQQQRTFLIMLTTLTLIMSVLMILFASAFMRPLSQLIAGTQRAINGELDAMVHLNSNDEFTQLSGQISELVSQMRTQANLINEKDSRYSTLLNTVVPPTVAKRLQQNKFQHGEAQIVNRVQQVTVLSATLIGFTELDEERSPVEVGKLLSAIAVCFHETSERLGLDSPLIIGEQLFAVCGLTMPRLDHAKRTVDFAQEMMEHLKRINERHQSQLRLQIGIHSGPMTAGVLGGQQREQQEGGWFNYNLWGKTLNIATHLSHQAGPNVVIMSRVVYERVEQMHPVVEYRSVDDVSGGGSGRRMMTWALASSLRMSQEQITRIQLTFAKVLPIADEIAQQFYANLFELDPDLRPFFKSDIREQQRKFIATLQVVIGGLASPEKIIPNAQELGRRHINYGVQDKHYDIVGAALLHALAQGLGDDFTPDVREAWGEMYNRISSVMKIAAADVE